MSPVLESRNGSLFGGIFIAAALAIGIAGPAQAASDMGSETLPTVACLIVDSDSNLDDLRAIAVIATQRSIAAVIATDGILPAKEGATTLARFLAGMPSPRPTIIRGQGRAGSSSSPPVFDWLQQTRAEAERLESELAQITPTSLPILASAAPAQLGEAVASATRDCPTLGVLMIGPWSSFVAYHAAIRERLRFVVIQGQPPDDPVDPDWDGVNCNFDAEACHIALQRLQGLSVKWVNLARNAPFSLDRGMIDNLRMTPLAQALRNIMQTDPSWRRQQLWDDAAAIFIVRPGAFKRVGDHYEPAISQAEMRTLEVQLANGEAP